MKEKYFSLKLDGYELKINLKKNPNFRRYNPNFLNSVFKETLHNLEADLILGPKNRDLTYKINFESLSHKEKILSEILFRNNK